MSLASKLIVALSELKDGLPEFSQPFCDFAVEASEVCLSENGHPLPVELRVDGEHNATCTLDWSRASQQALNSHNDHDAAAEFGAYAVALLLIPRLTEYTAIERSKKGTGFDYWLKTKEDELFQSKARLEVSGIFCGDERKLKTRCRTKITQCGKSNEHLPGYIVVVEFGRPIARLARRKPIPEDPNK